MFSGYLFNGYRRLSKQFIFWSIPVAVGMSHLLFDSLTSHGLTNDAVLVGMAGYSTYAWAKKTDAWMSSKEGHLALAEHHE